MKIDNTTYSELKVGKGEEMEKESTQINTDDLFSTSQEEANTKFYIYDSMEI